MYINEKCLWVKYLKLSFIVCHTSNVVLTILILCTMCDRYNPDQSVTRPQL